MRADQRRRFPLGWVAAGLFFVAGLVFTVLAKTADLGPEGVIAIWAWLGLSAIPACILYYGPSKEPLERRAGPPDRDLGSAFVWGGVGWLALSGVLAWGGGYGTASVFAILLGLNSIAVGASGGGPFGTRPSSHPLSADVRRLCGDASGHSGALSANGRGASPWPAPMASTDFPFLRIEAGRSPASA